MLPKLKARPRQKIHHPREHTTDMFDLHFEDLVSTPRAAKRLHALAYLLGFSLLGSSVTAASMVARLKP